MARDDSGALYAGGYQNSTGTFTYGGSASASSGTDANNAVVVKYNGDGSGAWARVVTGGAGASTFKRMATDDEGNVYAVGFQNGTGTFSYGSASDASATADYDGNNGVIVKYDSSGNALWARTVTGGGGKSYFNGVTVDRSGNIYAAGYQTGTGTYDYGNGITATAGTGTDIHALLVKYDKEGNALWCNITGGSQKTTFYGVASDDSDNIYAVGYI